MKRAAVFVGAVLALAGTASAQTPVINEVYYDAPGSDDGQVFVELWGPIGFDISDWSIIGIEGRGGSCGSPNPDEFTFPAGTVFTTNYIVVADELGSTGTTLVACFDFIDGDMDLENGGDAVHLMDNNGRLVDAVAYGDTDCQVGEGTPARDFFAPLSINRCPAGVDTDENSTDFSPNLPTPCTGPDCCSAIEWVSQGSGNSISASAGESVGLDFWITCAPDERYVVVLSCFDPATNPPPAGWPVFDTVCTPFVLGLVNVPPFVNWFGALDSSGASVGSAFLDFTGVPDPMLAADVDIWVGALSLTSPKLPTNSVMLTIEP